MLYKKKKDRKMESQPPKFCRTITETSSQPEFGSSPAAFFVHLPPAVISAVRLI